MTLNDIDLALSMLPDAGIAGAKQGAVFAGGIWFEGLLRREDAYPNLVICMPDLNASRIFIDGSQIVAIRD